MSIVLTLLLLQQLILFLTKTKPGVLACGLWCYSGKTPADPLKLKLLAMFNQSRGEDATGICADDTLIKDVVVAKEFIVKHTNFFDWKTYKPQTNFAVLGHCRKASFAYSYDKNKVKYAHPHKFEKDGAGFLVLVHNGSLTNHTDLAKKYDINPYDKTDTMILGEILVKLWNTEGNVLLEYDGSATIVFYPVSTKNTIYVHRDKERELYRWNETPDKMYVSSTKESLIAIGAKEEDVIEFAPGFLNKIVNGKVVKEFDYTKKIPYSTPKPKKLVPEKTAVRVTGKVEKGDENTDGFQVIKHFICHNGHRYTGALFENIRGGNHERFVLKGKEGDYIKHNVFCGIITKDEDAYKELFKLYGKNTNEVDNHAFSRVLPSFLQMYARYPIVGKTFSPNNECIVWSEKLETLETASDLYKWVLPLSGKEYSVNRAGFIITERELQGSKLTILEIINVLINNAVKDERTINNIYTLYNEYKAYKREQTVDIHLFMLNTIKYLESCNWFSTKEINELSELLDLGEIPGMDNSGVTIQARLGEYLENYQAKLRAQVDEVFPDAFDDEPVHENVPGVMANTTDYAEHTENFHESIPDEEIWKTQQFKEDILFGDYTSYDEVEQTYVVDNKETHRNLLIRSIALVFKEIGMIRETEYAAYRKDGYKVNIHKIRRLHDDFKKLTCLEFVNNVFEKANSHDGIAELYEEYLKLDAIIGKTTHQNIEFEIVKLALLYYKTKYSNNIDESVLKDTHGISKTELDKVC